VVSTDILLTGSGLVCCVASKPRIRQVHDVFFEYDRFSKTFQLPIFVIILGIDRSILEVIMYFIVYLGIQSGTTHNAYGRFAIYFVCLVPHIHLTQAFVLKPRKPRK
jgi:hypothetical protein